MERRRIPGSLAILRSDYAAHAVAIFVVMWVLLSIGVGIGFAWKNPVLTIVFAALTATIVLGGGGFAMLRTSRLRGLYLRGARVEGRVKRLGENAERVAYVDVEYSFASSTHELRHVTGKPRYDVGDKIDVLVDPDRPKRATVQSLR